MSNQKIDSRFIVGIDLGTTNSAVSYFDRLEPQKGLQTFSIEQWQSDGLTIKQKTLPSFCYIPHKNELKKQKYKLPSDPEGLQRDVVIGQFSKERASTDNERVINSAKSWLCHPSVDKEEKILPWHSDEIVGSKRYSPVEVSGFIIEHIKHAWDEELASHSLEYKLQNQEIIITVPASFDEVAQRLTLNAAEKAGLKRKNIKLLEEPQAAFYFWCHKNQVGKSSELLKIFPNLKDIEQNILICDIGGGTTDFSLFKINPVDVDQALPKMQRLRVGEHILLGGDNIDLHIAKFVEQKSGKTLDSQSWNQLISQARIIKEKALSQDLSQNNEEFHISLASGGSDLFAQTVSLTLSTEELHSIVIDGFFQSCTKNEKPEKKQGGIVEWGLNYPIDSSITKHLAEFLNGEVIQGVLFTGGTLTPNFIQNQLVNILQSWQEPSIAHLNNQEMDLAVSLGATSYGIINESKSFEVKSGYSKNLYLAALDKNHRHKLVSIIPKGFDSLDHITLDELPIKARINQVSCFYLFYSNTKKHNLGEVVEFNEAEFTPLPPLHAKLEIPGKTKSQQMINVGFKVRLEHTGLLDLICFSKDDPNLSWTLNFDTTGSHQGFSFQQAEGNSSPIETLKYLDKLIETFYGKKRLCEDASNPNQIIKVTEKKFSTDKKDWNLEMLRQVWGMLQKGTNRRGRSSNHEMAWLNLVGFSLRPGFGSEMDSFHVEELWKIHDQAMNFPNEAKVKDQWWIMWRRVAGGLSQEQQAKLFKKIFPTIKKNKDATPEMILLAGSLERLPMENKIQLGNSLVEQIMSGKKQYLDQKIWAISRLGSRQALYGGVQSVVRPTIIEKWFDKLSSLDSTKSLYNNLISFYIHAGRLVNDREFDLSDRLRNRFIAKLEASKATTEQISVIREFHAMNHDAKEELFGEKLPIGLLL